MRQAAVLLLVLALGMSMAMASEVTKLYPFTVVDGSTPLQVWQVTLTTDDEGNASYQAPFYGKLYSMQAEHDNALTGTKNLTVSSERPYSLLLQTYNLTAGNATLFPRSGGNMYPLCGPVLFTVTNASGLGGLDTDYRLILTLGV